MDLSKGVLTGQVQRTEPVQAMLPMDLHQETLLATRQAIAKERRESEDEFQAYLRWFYSPKIPCACPKAYEEGKAVGCTQRAVKNGPYCVSWTLGDCYCYCLQCRVPTTSYAPPDCSGEQPPLDEPPSKIVRYEKRCVCVNTEGARCLKPVLTQDTVFCGNCNEFQCDCVCPNCNDSRCRRAESGL